MKHGRKTGFNTSVSSLTFFCIFEAIDASKPFMEQFHNIQLGIANKKAYNYLLCIMRMTKKVGL
jgi:hypothetical protein